MKASQRPPKEMIKRVEQDVYDTCIECCQDNNAMFLIALNEEFGFGSERLKRVIGRFNEIQSRYDKIKMDGYSEYDFHRKLVEELEVAGISESQVYTERKDFVLSQRRTRLRDKSHEPSIREQLDAQKHLDMMKQLMHKEGYSIT